MRTKKLGIRFLSFLLILVMLGSVFPTTILAQGAGTDTPASGNDSGENSTVGGGLAESLGADETITYYEVRFELPDSFSEEEASEIHLPETALVPAKTLICALEEAERSDYLFNGWYYDEAYQEPAEGSDLVERNLTLYPSFVPIQSFDDEFRINYISSLDVEPDFDAEVVAYGLTENEAREQLTVRNLSKVNGWEDFSLERLAPDMETLIPDAAIREQAMEIIERAQSGELEGTLTDALAAGFEPADAADKPEADPAAGEDDGEEKVFISDAALAEIIAFYAPEESEQSIAVRASDLIKRVNAAGLDPKAVTLSDLSGILTEDDLSQSDLLDMLLDLALLSDGNQAINLEEVYADVLENLPTAHYRVMPESGLWSRGDLHQIEIHDTGSLRFFRDREASSQYVIYYNIKVYQENFNNMQLRNGLCFLPYNEVEGVELDGGLYQADATDGESATVSANESSGEFLYTGSETLTAGMTVAIYDGTLNADGTVDGSVGYFNITGVEGGGRYLYESADFTDVIFVPDIIPARDDGSFADGEILLPSDQLSFTGEPYVTLGLDADTTVDPGDFLAVYTGSMTDPNGMGLTGYGLVTAVEAQGEDLLVRYEVVEEETMLRSADMYQNMENAPLDLTEEDFRQIESQLEEEMAESDFAEETYTYIEGLILGEEAAFSDPQYANALQDVKFQREDGSEISLEEVRRLAGGGTVEFDWPPQWKLQLGAKLQHFSGFGLRLEGSVELGLTINLNSTSSANNKLKLTVVGMIEVEVLLSAGVKFEVEWRRWMVFPYIYDINGHVGLQAGIYAGLGFTITITTEAEQKGGSFDEFAKQENRSSTGVNGEAISKLGKLKSTIDQVAKAAKVGGDNGLGITAIGTSSTSQTTNSSTMTEMNNTVGGHFEDKYTAFMEGSKAEYVTIFEPKEPLVDLRLPTDPFHVTTITVSVKFTIKFKVNVMLGASITYANAKEIAANFSVFHGEAETTTGDLETPNFQVDFYIFGMLGLRFGFPIDIRVGVVSTKLASLGVVVEPGVYIEFYGYFYVAYRWESGKGSSSEMFGALLLQAGIYLDIRFKAQMGDDRLKKEIELYSVKWPILSFGTQYCALDFKIAENSEKLNLDIKEGTSIKVPDELYDIYFLELNSGNQSSSSVDSDAVVNNGGASFSAMGITYTQMDEQNLHVTYKPLGKDFGTPTAADKAKGSFLYNPYDNTITAKPNNCTGEVEMWGEFTFTYYQGKAKVDGTTLLNVGAGFGLNTRQISRTVRVHWKGTPMTAAVHVYFEKEGLGGKEAVDDQIEWHERNLAFYEYLLANDLNTGERPVFNPNGLLSYFTEASTENFDGLVDCYYLIDLNEGLGVRFPGYELYFIVAPYDPEVLKAYTDQYNEAVKNKADQATLDSLKRRIERYQETNGYSFADYQDELLYFMMRKPTTEVHLYYVESEYAADWYYEYSNLGKREINTSLVAEGVSFAQGTNIIENTPQTVLDKMNDPGYDYVRLLA